MIHGAGYGFIQLTMVNAADCQMQLIARDGVFHYTPYIQIDTIVMVQGSRSDVAIKCSTPGIRTFQIKPNNAFDKLLSTINPYSQDQVFYIDVQAGNTTTQRDFPTSQAPLPTYLNTLQNAQVSKGKKGLTRITLAQELNGKFAINKIQFPGWEAQEYIEELCVNHVYEFITDPPQLTLPMLRQPKNPVPPHPYHQHINHLQIYDNTDPTGTIVRQHEWRDVIPALQNFGVTFRFNATEYTGKVVVHCHILEHEDGGMMGLFLITPNCTASQISSATSITMLDFVFVFFCVLALQ